MSMIFKEENGFYGIDCTHAVWATDQLHDIYEKSKVQLNDVDFIIETDENILLVEYKNANIPGAAAPEKFDPMTGRSFDRVVRKFYDSLHYLRLIEKTKPAVYVYILEYPKGDIVMRKRLRNNMKQKLPFALQDNVNPNMPIIDGVDVVSISEWNKNTTYGKYPISPCDR